MKKAIPPAPLISSVNLLLENVNANSFAELGLIGKNCIRPWLRSMTSMLISKDPLPKSSYPGQPRGELI